MRTRRLMHALGPVMITVLAAQGTAGAQTYYIDESTDYTGNGCENWDLNTVTSSLKSALDGNGWSGSRFTNALAWPQDFIEACDISFGNGGLDSSYADTKLLSVFAGHGNQGRLQWGFPHNGRCIIIFQPNMRLGCMAGATSGFGMYVSSCTLNTASLVNHANRQWLRQQFGYHNTPSVKDDQPRDFFNATSSSSNKNAWLDQMEDKPGWFTGDNSPIVVSYGTNSTDCLNTHNNAKLKGNVLRSARSGGPVCLAGQSGFSFCWTLRDNGGC